MLRRAITARLSLPPSPTGPLRSMVTQDRPPVSRRSGVPDPQLLPLRGKFRNISRNQPGVERGARPNGRDAELAKTQKAEVERLRDLLERR